MLRFWFLLFCLFGWGLSLNAQFLDDDAPPPDAVLININYGFQLPGADLAERFGASSTIGGSVEYLRGKVVFGVQGGFLFGGRVKTDVLAGLRTDEGGIITVNNATVLVPLSERGWFVGGMAGMIIPFTKAQRSGLRLTVGANLLEHKIRIDTGRESILQLQDPYKKGYDRLTNGLALTEFIGYHYFSENQLVNFSIGFEFMQGFTQGRRSLNYDTMLPDDQPRLDLLYGLRVGWTLPLFFDGGNRYY